MKEVNNMENKKSITQLSGDELVKIVSKTLKCPICGLDCASEWDVYAHISKEHPPMPINEVAS